MPVGLLLCVVAKDTAFFFLLLTGCSERKDLIWPIVFYYNKNIFVSELMGFRAWDPFLDVHMERGCPNGTTSLGPHVCSIL